jgi:hypothetical protein
LFERCDQSILRELFGQTNIADDSRESRDDSRGLDPPHSVDGAMRGGSFDLGGHGDPFNW